MAIDKWHFQQYVDAIAERSGLGAHKEHECIFEFYEAEEIPIFKLIFGPSDKSDGVNVVIVTFRLGLDPVDAIQWYHRVKHVIHDIRLQASYYKDDQGETYLGEHAEAIKMHKDEQEILGRYIESKRDDETVEAYTKGKVYGRNREKKKMFTDVDAAMAEFNRLFMPDEDEIQ